MLELFKSIINEQDEDFSDIAGLLGGDEDQTDHEDQHSDDQHSLLKGAENGEQEDHQTDPDTQDPDKQGLIRRVPGAHLVYKRKGEDGMYEELWIYNVSKMQQQLDTRKAILAGTDIEPRKQTSEDGKQTCKSWTVGNAELLHIEGLQN
jgi:hypothetical protein